MKPASTLRVFLTGQWPRGDAACGWALLAPDMRVIRRGVGDARQWPAADACEVVVSAEQVSWLSAALPEKLGRDADRIIGFALEDKLLAPPETMHLVAARRAGGGTTTVIAIERARLREIIGSLAAAGRSPDRMVVDMQLAPLAAGDWMLCRHGADSFLRMGQDGGLAVDWADAAPPPALLLAMRQAQTRGQLPGRLLVATAPEQAPDPAAWSAALGIPVVLHAAFDPLVAPTAGASNLLSGQFARAGRPVFLDRGLRLTVAILLLAGIGHTLLSLADWAWLAYQASALRREAVAIYREAMPESKVPLLNPNLQLHREIATVLRDHGRVGRTDMLTMLSVVVGALPPDTQLRRVQFDSAALEIVAVLPDRAVPAIGESLRVQGYGHAIRALRPEAAATEYSIRMFLP